jgi:MFS family permease
MEEQNVQGNESAETKNDAGAANRKRRIIVWISGLLAAVVVAGVLVGVLIPWIANVGWVSNTMIALYIAVGLAAAAAGAWLILRRTVRTRLRMQKVMKLDPDINDWLIIFNWTPKVLYAPTIVASLAASSLMFLNEAGWWLFGSIPALVIGGIWLAIFFLNFLIEEYSISVKVLLIILVSIGFFLLWLHLLGWVMDFLRLFKHLALSVNAAGYLLVGVIGLFTILTSWLKGLFYYVTITPNYMNLQEGPTESGEQIGREDYNSRVDTSDFLERLMGFGKIVITFKGKNREPIAVLVWGIRKKAQMLERVRAKFAIDQVQPAQLRPQSSNAD